MLTKSERTLSLNSCWTMLSIVAFLAIAPMAAGSSANAANFSFTQIDVPGAIFTEAFDINDAGQIVGGFNDSTGSHGFLLGHRQVVVSEPTEGRVGTGFRLRQQPR